MSETTAPPPAAEAPPSAVPASEAAGPSSMEEAVEVPSRTVDIRSLLEAGAHFGHQTRRWNPKMRGFIFGERNGIHILDLDQTLPLLREALDYVNEVTSQGGSVLFVGTKKAAAPAVLAEARRAGQPYVNNRWLGGMLTNWRTVKKSCERYTELIEIFEDEEKRSEHSKKVLAGMTRQREKYEKSLEGMRTMAKLPDALFVIDVMKEAIAITEAKRLGIPIIAIVDSNCNPDNVDFVIPGNDDALRAIDYYCGLVAEACIAGKQAYQERIQSQSSAEAPRDSQPAAASGRRVVEITQPPRRGRGGARDGTTSGRTASAGGWGDRKEGEAAAGAKDEAAAKPEGAAAPEEAPAAEAAPAGDAPKPDATS